MFFMRSVVLVVVAATWSSTASAFTCDGTGTLPSHTQVVSGCTATDAAGASCVRACVTGFYQVGGSTTQTCASPGGSYPTSDLACAAITCTGLPIPPHTQVESGCTSHDTYSSDCVLGCSPGFYQTAGTTTRSCDLAAAGPYPASDLVCSAVVCGNPPLPPNTQVVSGCTGSDAYGSTCQLACATGFYETAGSTTETCNLVASGNYPSSDLVCSAVTCSNSALPANAQIEAGCTGSDAYGSTCTLECQPGFYPTAGSLTRACILTSPGPYPASNLVCSAIACSNSALPPNAQVESGCTGVDPYGSTCTLECRTGFYASAGSQTRTCNLASSGAYPASNLVCSAVTCGNPPLPPNTQIVSGCTGSDAFGASCVLGCATGFYKTAGSTTETCNLAASGNYPSSDLVCSAITCSNSALPANAQIEAGCTGSDAYGSTCTLECATGFYPTAGSLTRTCNLASPGPYPASNLVCSAITCSNSALPPNTQVSSGCTGIDPYGSTCALACASGYHLGKGSATRTCDLDASGSYPASDLVCYSDSVTCSTPTPLPASSSVVSGCTAADASGSSCVLACNAGTYQASGSTTRVCNQAATGPYAASNLVCTTCSTCGSGSYVVSACTATANTTCGSCDSSCASCSGSSPSQCLTCPNGSYLSGGTCRACATCDPGSYQSSACTPFTDTACATCTAGTYATNAGSLVCTMCDAGMFSGAGASACTACAPGTSSTAGQNTCATCDAGSFADGGAATCTQCNAGTFSAAGAQDCTACPAGMAAIAGQGACTACSPGSYAASTQSSTCTACLAGYAAATAGAMSCDPCVAGTFSADAGSTTCSTCPSGTFSLGAASSCDSCGSCDDGNPCTQDSCDATAGCRHTAIQSCGGDMKSSADMEPSTDMESSGTMDASAPSDMESSTSKHSGCAMAGHAPSSSTVPLALFFCVCVIAWRSRRRDER